VAVDHFSGYTWATLLPTQGAEQLADYLYAVFSVEGVPTTYQCDNARNFDADCIHQAIDEAIKATSGMNNGDGPGPRNIVHGLPYNPRAQGKVERKNSVLKNKFYKRIKDIWSKGSGTQIDIVREMAGVVARENSAINTRNGYTPYQILRGLDVDNRPILDRTAMWAEVAIAQRKQGEADLKRLTEKSDKRRKRIQLEVGDPVRARNYTPAKTSPVERCGYRRSGNGFRRTVPRSASETQPLCSHQSAATGTPTTSVDSYSNRVRHRHVTAVAS